MTYMILLLLIAPIFSVIGGYFIEKAAAAVKEKALRRTPRAFKYGIQKLNFRDSTQQKRAG